MLYNVIEEIWSLSSDGNQRRIPSSGRPLFSGGGSSIAYRFAEERASKFVIRGFHEDAEDSYWWGRNEGDRVNHRFVIRLAPLNSHLPPSTSLGSWANVSAGPQPLPQRGQLCRRPPACRRP
jgi:hypothetical protein